MVLCYGTAVARAQRAIQETGDKPKEIGAKTFYAIHPVVGRMPGHMNVPLAEVNAHYDAVFEPRDTNHQFTWTDVAFVIGANEVISPAAKKDP